MYLFYVYHQRTIVDSLSPDQKAGLILDPDRGAIDNVTLVKEVLASVTESIDDDDDDDDDEDDDDFEQLKQFFHTFAAISKRVNT